MSKNWGTIDDVIMGGNSMSTTQCLQEHGTNDFVLVFKGDLSLRNGGFCGARARNANPAYDLRAFEGIRFWSRSKQNF